MDLTSITKIVRSRINRTVLPEAKQLSRQAWLWLKKAASESLFKLLFRLALREVISDFLKFLIDNLTG